MTLNEGPHHIHTTTATIGGSRVIANEYNYVFISDGTPSISNNQRSMDLDAEMNSININLSCLTYTYYYSYPWTQWFDTETTESIQSHYEWIIKIIESVIIKIRLTNVTPFCKYHPYPKERQIERRE